MENKDKIITIFLIVLLIGVFVYAVAEATENIVSLPEGVLLVNPIKSINSVQAFNNSWLYFDGIDDYIQTNKTTESPEINGTNNPNLTISFWFDTASTSPIQPLNSDLSGLIGMRTNLNKMHIILNRNSSAGGSFGTMIVRVWNQTNNSIFSQFGTLQNFTGVNATYFYTVTITNTTTGTNVTMYNNGTLIFSGTSTLNMVNNYTGDIRIGGNILSGVTRYHLGIMDDIRFYNRTLNSKEISTIYNESRNPNTNITSGLFLRYKLDESNGSRAYDLINGGFAT